MRNVYGGVYPHDLAGLRAEGYLFATCRAGVQREPRRAPRASGHGCRLGRDAPNPMLNLIDIRAAAEARTRPVRSSSSKTRSRPQYLQQPLELGADVVVHSRRSNLGGHSESSAASRRRNYPTIARALYFLQKSLRRDPGAVRLLARAARREDARRADEAALRERAAGGVLPRVARSGRTSPLTGIETHPGTRVAARQMRDFRDESPSSRGRRKRRSSCSPAQDLGSCREPRRGREPDRAPGCMTTPRRRTPRSRHREPRRLSVGIESADDLVADLEAAPFARPQPRDVSSPLADGHTSKEAWLPGREVRPTPRRGTRGHPLPAFDRTEECAPICDDSAPEVRGLSTGSHRGWHSTTGLRKSGALSPEPIRFHPRPIGVLGVYLVETPEGLALFDCGPTSTLAALEAGLRGRGVTLADPRHHWTASRKSTSTSGGGRHTIVREHPASRCTCPDRRPPTSSTPRRLERSARRLTARPSIRCGELARCPSGTSGCREQPQPRVLPHSRPRLAPHVSYLGGDGTLTRATTQASDLQPGRHIMPVSPPPDVDLEGWERTFEEIAPAPGPLALIHFGVVDDPLSTCRACARLSRAGRAGVSRGRIRGGFLAAARAGSPPRGYECAYYERAAPPLAVVRRAQAVLGQTRRRGGLTLPPAAARLGRREARRARRTRVSGSLLGRVVSFFGNSLSLVAVAFAVLIDLDASPSKLGRVLAARIVPQVVFLLAGGSGRPLPRHLVMVASNAVSGASATAMTQRSC